MTLDDLIITPLDEYTVNDYTWKIGDRFLPTADTDVLIPTDRCVIDSMYLISLPKESEVLPVFGVRITNLEYGTKNRFMIRNIDTILPY